MRHIPRSILVLTLVAMILGVGQVALAQETCGKIPFIPSVTVPGTPIEQGKTYDLDCTSIGTYIISLYQFGVYAASVVAAVMIMVGGFLWVTAGGNASQVSTAKSFVGGALSGFVLLLGSWLILNTINPNLVRFNPLTIKVVTNEPIDAETGCQATPEGFDYGAQFPGLWEKKPENLCQRPSSIGSNIDYDCWCPTKKNANVSYRCTYYHRGMTVAEQTKCPTTTSCIVDVCLEPADTPASQSRCRAPIGTQTHVAIIDPTTDRSLIIDPNAGQTVITDTAASNPLNVCGDPTVVPFLRDKQLCNSCK